MFFTRIGQRWLPLFLILVVLFGVARADAGKTESLEFDYDVVPPVVGDASKLSTPHGRIQVTLSFADKNETPKEVDDSLWLSFDTEFLKWVTARIQTLMKDLPPKVEAFDKALPLADKEPTTDKKAKVMDAPLAALNKQYLSSLVEVVADEILGKAEAVWKTKSSSYKDVNMSVTVSLDGTVIPPKGSWTRFFKKKNPTRVEALANVDCFEFEPVDGVSTDGKIMTVSRSFPFASYQNRAWVDEPGALEYSYEVPADLEANHHNLVHHRLTNWLASEAQKFDAEVIVPALKNAAKIASTDADLENKLNVIAQKMQSDYQTRVEKVRSEIETQVNQYCKQIAETKKASWMFKLKVAFRIGKSIFSLTTAVARLVATEGADVEAWFAVANNLYEIGKNLKTALDGVNASLKRLNKAYDELEEAMAKNMSKYKVLGELLKDRDVINKNSECKSVLEEYESKVAGVYRQVNRAFSQLETLLAVQEHIQNEELKKVAAKANDCILKIIDLNIELLRRQADIERAGKLIEDAKEMVGMKGDGFAMTFLKEQIAAFNPVDMAADKLGVSEYLTAATNLVEVAKEAVDLAKKKK